MSDIKPTDAWQAMFADPDAVARYVNGPPRFMPGYHDVQLMAGVLLAEHVRADGEVLVLGAGGGLEIKTLDEFRPDWRFTGVDPSAQMLGLAAQILEHMSERVTFIEGTVAAAAEGPFDCATCLLTLHFLERAQRLEALRQLHKRLKPGAPLVVAHQSFPNTAPERELWLSRYAAFARGAGADPDMVAMALEKVAANLEALTPEEDVGMLQAAGFADVTKFYQGFTWQGWVAYTPK